MLTKTRSDFWKCGRCGELLVRVDEAHACYFDEELRHALDYRPTPAQVLAAWLQADDERRREIEIASMPTGNYAERYRVFFMDEYGMLNNTDLTEVIDSDVALEEDGLLWFELEPTE